MMKEEFDKLVGFETRYEEYEEIEAEYMGTEIDKVRFAAEWKKNGGIQRLCRIRTRIIEELDERVKQLEREKQKERERHQQIEEKLKQDLKSYDDTWNKNHARFQEVSDSLEEANKRLAAIKELVAS